MSRDLYIQDTAEVHITSLLTGNVIGVGYAQTAGFEQTTEETDIRGGIGNKLAYTIRSSKDIELTITSATFKPEFLEMMQGSEFEEEVTREVTRSGRGRVEGDDDGLFISMPSGLEELKVIRIVDDKGKQVDVDVDAGEAVLPADVLFEEGHEVEFYYLQEVTGRALNIDATKFGGKVKVEYRTICYDRETAVIHSDLYFIFPECIPSGNYGMTFQNGEAFIPEMTFKTTAPEGSDVIGTKLEVLRDEAQADTP